MPAGQLTHNVGFWRAYPRNQTLVESRNTTSSPDVPECLTHCLGTVRSHLSLENLEGLSKGSDLEHVHRGTYHELLRSLYALFRRDGQSPPLSGLVGDLRKSKL
jgi:hypothetical protein